MAGSRPKRASAPSARPPRAAAKAAGADTAGDGPQPQGLRDALRAAAGPAGIVGLAAAWAWFFKLGPSAARRPEPWELPNLTEPYALSKAQASHFRERGWVAAPGLLSEAEAQAWRPYVEDAVAAHGQAGGRGQEPFQRLDNLWLKDDSHVLARLSTAPRVARLAGELLGCEEVRLYKDTVFFKSSEQGESPWHQDHIATPFAADARVVNCWITLEDIPAGASALTFAEGSHAERLLLFGPGGREAFREALGRHRSWATAAPMRAGDATCHTSWTMHGADKQPGRARKAMSMMLLCNGSRFAKEPELQGRSQDDLPLWRRVWETGGFAYGRPVATPLFPRVHPPSGEWQQAGGLPALQRWPDEE